MNTVISEIAQTIIENGYPGQIWDLAELHDQIKRDFELESIRKTQENRLKHPQICNRCNKTFNDEDYKLYVMKCLKCRTFLKKKLDKAKIKKQNIDGIPWNPFHLI